MKNSKTQSDYKAQLKTKYAAIFSPETGYLDIYTPVHDVIKILISVCLVYSAFASTFFYRDLLKHIPKDLQIFIAGFISVLVSVLIGFTLKHSAKIYFRGQAILDRFDIISLFCCVLLGWNCYTDLNGVQNGSESFHEEITDTRTQILNDNFKIKTAALKQQIEKAEEASKANNGWKKAKASGRAWYGSYKRQKAADSLAANLNRQLQKVIQENDKATATSTQLFIGQLKKRDKKVKNLANTGRGLVAVCMLFILLATFWLYAFGRRIANDQKAVQSTLNDKSDGTKQTKRDENETVYKVHKTKQSARDKYPKTTELLKDSNYSLQSACDEAGEGCSKGTAHRIRKDLQQLKQA